MFSAAEYWLVTKTLRREEKKIYICIPTCKCIFFKFNKTSRGYSIFYFQLQRYMQATQLPSFGAQTLLFFFNKSFSYQSIYQPVWWARTGCLNSGWERRTPARLLSQPQPPHLLPECCVAQIHKHLWLVEFGTISSRSHHHSYVGIEEGQMVRCSAVTSFTISS